MHKVIMIYDNYSYRDNLNHHDHNLHHHNDNDDYNDDTSSSLGSSFSSCSLSFSKRRLLRLLDCFQLLKLSAKCIVKNILSTSSS